jgi:protein associated with RNAse G/E
MTEYIQSLPDGWTIYVWMIAAAAILIGAAFFLRWAVKNFQFDEDIKYMVFDENDKDKMDEEEFKKSMRVQKEQEELRVKVLKERAEERAKKHAKG